MGPRSGALFLTLPGWGPGPTHLPIKVPQHEEHRPTVALHLPVQAPQTEAVP